MTPQISRAREQARGTAIALFGEVMFPHPITKPAGRSAATNESLVNQLRAKGVLRSPAVVEAFRSVRRAAFVPDECAARAYEDTPLSIGFGQTISQPTIVAIMTEALELDPAHRVLEIGTGSGYQTAILAHLVREVFSIERVIPLAKRAHAVFELLGLTVHTRIGDGYRGWPEAAPFDRIVLTAAPPQIPQALIDQLAEGGLFLGPFGGERKQDLVRVEKRGSTIVRRRIESVQFVPMIKGVTLG